MSAGEIQVFATRVWGFEPTTWPVIVFGLEGNRDKLLRESRAGDRIVFVATKTDDARSEDRGRLLGMAEISRTAVDTAKVVAPEHIKPTDRGPDGRIAWPKAILMLRAWRFPERPLLLEVLGRQLSYLATPAAVLLTADEARKVLSLEAEEAELPMSEVLMRERRFVQGLTSVRGPTRGPVPVSWTKEVMHEASGPAFTYAFRFGKRNVWKIGWSADLPVRLREVNTHVPLEETGEGWCQFLSHRHAAPVRAHEMEQRLLELLAQYRTAGERVRCQQSELQTAWVAALRG
ncbi:hypothetical protein JYK02_37285 [Corallococcus macrosporus]|uniref:GIY-YIG nuclease family protein n=1 Tax=Corallococcus macrosporus TaxID=35 RepID=A0ABS3DPJ1_9BACT|nr:hypothetical protein [Corallococcus macrosporus]MBN8233183.1 hypothetical protein [Corallococcus macrosporus]